MGGGGLMQLVAYGAQDIYLTGKPQITFWKSVYRRYTNFAVESIQQDVLGSAQFGSQVSVTISRNGDLLKRMWLEYSPYDILQGVNSNLLGYPGVTVGANLGHSLIDYIDIEIGGQNIDRHYGKWLTIYNYLTDNETNITQAPIDDNCFGPGEQTNPAVGDSAYNTYSPRPTKYQRMAYTHKGNTSITNSTGAPMYAYVPLQFWFCRNPGLAIPLIALQYHDVRINIEFGAYNGICSGTATGLEFQGFAVYADYVYLDVTERRQFAQNAHEYLIEQVQLNC
jgi:hypothetical protein